jgi:thiamine pyrophosphokinase
MTKFAVLLRGDLHSTDRLKRQLAGARVIAADAGMMHAGPLGLEAELWVGDFDSASPALLAHAGHVPRQTFPADKDASDGELAVRAALDRGAREIILAGGFGGQSDHAFAHMTLALGLARAGIAAFVTSGHEEAWPLHPGEHRLDAPAGSRLSVLALSDLQGLSLAGVRWPLERRAVALGSTLTLSNEVSGAVTVSLAAGNGIIIVTPPLTAAR